MKFAIEFFLCNTVHIFSTRVVIWITLQTTAVICMQISVASNHFGYFIEYSILAIILAMGIGEIVCLSFAANFEK